MALQVIQGPKVLLGSQDRLADKADQEDKDSPDHEDPRERKETKELVRWETMDLQVHQVSPDPQVMVRWAPQVLLASRAFLESRALLDPLVQRGKTVGVILVTV